MEILQSPLAWVFVAALITAVATGLGAVPFFFAKEFSPKFLGSGNALAAGLMIAASFNLMAEGIAEDAIMTSWGIFIGLVFIVLSAMFLERHEDIQFAHIDKLEGRKILLILAVMTAHSFTEGIGVGVSFGRSESFGSLISAAIALHNIPEGLAISLVMVPRGVSALRAMGWSIFSSLPQPLMAVPAFLFVETFSEFLPAGLGFAGGAMIWMSISEILPDAAKDISWNRIAIIVVISLIGMILFQEFLS
ncbi:MAG: ZIP family metal transporter [Balneolaceae bacterium]|nr:ZIP family metal transporter [Balneolaceae bacterium]MDR9446800.1 ZIP family metal transporter [Balneolaceae bacterium]